MLDDGGYCRPPRWKRPGEVSRFMWSERHRYADSVDLMIEMMADFAPGPEELAILYEEVELTWRDLNAGTAGGGVMEDTPVELFGQTIKRAKTKHPRGPMASEAAAAPEGFGLSSEQLAILKMVRSNSRGRRPKVKPKGNAGGKAASKAKGKRKAG